MRKAGIIGVGPDQGLGAQLRKRFAKENLHVIAAGRTLASLDAVVADIEAAGGGKASFFVADATNEANVAALVDHAGPEVNLAIVARDFLSQKYFRRQSGPRSVDRVDQLVEA